MSLCEISNREPTWIGYKMVTQTKQLSDMYLPMLYFSRISVIICLFKQIPIITGVIKGLSYTYMEK